MTSTFAKDMLLLKAEAEIRSLKDALKSESEKRAAAEAALAATHKQQSR